MTVVSTYSDIKFMGSESSGCCVCYWWLHLAEHWQYCPLAMERCTNWYRNSDPSNQIIINMLDSPLSGYACSPLAVERCKQSIRPSPVNIVCIVVSKYDGSLVEMVIWLLWPWWMTTFGWSPRCWHGWWDVVSTVLHCPVHFSHASQNKLWTERRADVLYEKEANICTVWWQKVH